MNTARSWLLLGAAAGLNLFLQSPLQAQRASYQQTVTKAGTIAALQSSSNPATLGLPITFTAHVAPLQAGQILQPSGSVTFVATDSAGKTVGQQSPVDHNGAAAWTTQLPTGDFTITAQYSGDTNYLGAISGPLLQNIMGTPDFTLSMPTSLAVHQGESVAAAITVKALNGFSGPVALTSFVDGPTSITSVFSPGTLAASPAESRSMFTITTLAATVKAAGLAGVFLSLLFSSRRRNTKPSHYQRPLGLIALLLLTSFWAGCGGGSLRYIQTDGTPRGSYSISITGTSGSISHSQTLTLKVQ